MRGINHVLLAGNLGRDPDLRHTDSGTPVCNFSIAINEVWTDKNGTQNERTEWARIVTWDRLAENCGKYLTKGSPVLVIGKMQTREYTDRDGNERKSTEVQARRVEFLGSGEKREPEQDHITDDEIPF